MKRIAVRISIATLAIWFVGTGIQGVVFLQSRAAVHEAFKSAMDHTPPENSMMAAFRQDVERRGWTVRTETLKVTPGNGVNVVEVDVSKFIRWGGVWRKQMIVHVKGSPY